MLAQQLAAVLATIAHTPMTDARRELWNNAAVKAFNQLYDGIRIDRDDDGTFIFPSRSRGGLSHHVNGTCDCEAAVEQHAPCWHRPAKAMALGVEQATFTSAAPPPPAPEPQPYHCPHCASPMHAGLTPGGEDCIACVNPACQKTILSEVVEAFFA
jgi:hypothetical protein